MTIRRIGRLFTHLFLGILFLVLGLLCLAVPYSYLVRYHLLEFIFDHAPFVALLGLAFFGMAFYIILSAISTARHSSVAIQTGPMSIVIQEAVIRKYLEQYWKTKFPDTHVPFQIKFKKKAIQISANLPNTPIEKEQIREDLIDIFGRLLGYPHDIELIATR